MTAKSLTRADLLAPFRPAADPRERIGMEVECAVLDVVTGRAAPYGGPTGSGRLLELIRLAEHAEPLPGYRGATGVRLPDGATATLEASGSLEYSSPPAPDLVTLVEAMRGTLRTFAGHAATLGLALVPGGNLPFDPVDGVEWIPNPHVRLMRRFFEGTGDAGVATNDISALAVTTQTTLDLTSERDRTEKLRVAFAASAVAAALFANSPLYDGKPSGYLSWRMSRLRREDPNRCGLPPFALRPDISAEHYVDWLLGLPMIHRTRDGIEEPAPDRPFADLLAAGFDDGSQPTAADWDAQISQTWPFVRMRSTMELRLADSPPAADLAAAPAFWTGLLYHRPSREAAWELLRGRTIADHLQTIESVALSGLAGDHDGRPVAAFAAELLTLADDGLRARVAAGLEKPAAIGYLEPLREVVDSGQTYADQQLRRWETDLARSPERFVAAYRI